MSCHSRAPSGLPTAAGPLSVRLGTAPLRFDVLRTPMATIYTRAVPVERKPGHTRIYAPVSYALVRRLNVVPAVHVEAFGLARWFPVVWRRSGRQIEFAAVRSLLADGRGHPPGSPRVPTSLPLLLRAYPFRLEGTGVVDEDGGADGLGIALDDAAADEPTDIGAPIVIGPNRLGRGAEQRCRALGLFARALKATRAMTAYLSAEDLLEPWPLSFDIAGPTCRIDNLFVLRGETARTGRLAGFVGRFGPDGARLLAAHQLSLFRAGPLVVAAKQALRA